MLVALTSFILCFLVAEMSAVDVDKKSTNLRATNGNKELQKAAATYYGEIIYSDLKKLTQCEKVESFMLWSLSYCQKTTSEGSTVVTGHMKHSCDTNSAAYVYYEASDTTCATPTNSVPIGNYGICPSTALTPKPVCLGSADVSSLTKKVKGVTYTYYPSKSTCKAKDSSAVKLIYFKKDLFTFEDGTSLYQCITRNKGSYAYVCNGEDGIQALSYTTTNCKGKAKQMSKTKFVCQDSPESMDYATATCIGPPNMN